MPAYLDLKPAAPWREVRCAAEDWKALGASELRGMLGQLHLIRSFEEMVLELYAEGLVHGPAHSSIGQEGGAVGAIWPMRPTDQVTGSHRGHHQFLAKALRYADAAGGDPFAKPSDAERTILRRALAEIMGLAEGYCSGRGGSMHLRWAEAGALGTNAIVGGGVPLAAGVAWAKKRQGNGDVVFTFLGDGAASAGAVTETMNLAALWNLPICFFIENNFYAVATTIAEATRESRVSARGLAFGIPAFRVDGMNPVAVHAAARAAIDLLRQGKGPMVIEAEVYRFHHHGGNLLGSAFGYRSKEEEKTWRARDPLELMARELIARGWLTPEENESLRARAQEVMAETASALTSREGNKRFIPAGKWPDPSFRDEGVRGDLSEFTGVRFEESETFGGKLDDVKFIDVVARVMERRMAEDARIFCLGEDIHKMRGGTNGATRGLFERFPDRVLATPITEEAFCGFSGGVAMEGSYRPVVELMYPDFALVAADQLFNQIGKIRHMFGGGTAVPVVVRTKIAFGTGYGAQHSMDPAGLFSQWPGWRIVAPSTPFDYVGLMNSALRCEDPVLVIEHVDLYASTGQGPIDDLDYFIPLGRAKVARSGSAFTVLTYLSMTSLAIRAANEMRVDAEVIDLRSLDRAGIDWDAIGESIRKTNNVVILEQGPLSTSYGALLADEIQRRYFDWLDQPVKRIHGGEASPSISKVLERAAIVSIDQIRKGYAEILTDVGVPAHAAQ